VTWDSSKRENFGKRGDKEKKMRHKVLKKSRRS
jgi:hypothetical protein